MKISQAILAGILVTLGALPGISATLTVQATATPDAGLYDYSYQFAVGGVGASVDNIFLGGNDLSPLNLVLKVDGAPTADWSWLGNDTPENYLQFFDTAGTALGNLDVLDVTFSSKFAPTTAGFAVGLDSSTSASTNTVNGVLTPTAVPVATPEPGSLLLLVPGIAILAALRKRTVAVIR